tara:strand:+ start:694 stop:1107 length:414 start_codon:yes stop_codon:yes gene_type:complete
MIKNLTILLLLLPGCSTLLTAAGAGGGAAIGSFAGPGGSAAGAIAGVIATDLATAETPLGEGAGVQPDGQIASTVHETATLIETVGMWYLLIFVFLPFLTKRGRGWLKNLTRLHDNVSKKEVESLVEELKKQVNSSK